MKDEVDFVKELQDLEARAKNIDEKARLYKNRILEQQLQIQETEASVKEAEMRASAAEKLAAEANAKYRKAIELKEGQYVQLIHDLFERPQKELTSHTKQQSDKLLSKMTAQSRVSNSKTVRVAILSIVLSTLTSLLLSLYFQSQNAKSMHDLVERVNSVADRTEVVVENISDADPLIKRLSEFISKNRSEFSGYKTKSDLALAYKMRIGREAGSARYADIIKALRVAGISKDSIPNVDLLKHWDDEYVQLCQNAVNQVSTKNMTQPASDEDRLFRTFKTANDDTDYGGWAWTGQLSNEAVRNAFQYDLNSAQKRIAFNNNPSGTGDK